MNSHPRFGVLFLCVSLLAALAFGRSLEAPFFWDDDALIVGNPWLGTPSGLPRFFTPAFWRGLSFAEDYRPIEMTSYSLDHAFWDDNPVGYHLSNLLLHAFNCAALTALAWILFGSAPLAITAGVLFALHPMHSEPVAWIQNRSELLSAAFSLVCVCAFARWARGGKSGGACPPKTPPACPATWRFERACPPAPRTASPPAESRWRGLYACACAAFVLACLTKESAVVLPLMCASVLALPRPPTLPELERWRAGPPRHRAWAGLVPLAAIAALFLFIKLGVLPHSRPSPASSLLVGAYPRAAAVAKTLAIYLALLAFPARFSLDRFFAIPVFPPHAALLLGAAAVTLAFAFAARGLMGKKPWGAALALTLAPLLPVSNIVFISGRPLAEQRVYLASAGFCLCAAILIERAARAPRARAGVAALTLALAASWLIASVKRTDYWRSEQVLWERTLEVSPSSWRAKLFLSRVYRREGRSDDAVALIKEILRYSEPMPPIALVDLGRVYTTLGWDDRARDAFQRAVASDPGEFTARACLGEAYRRERRFPEALAQFQVIERGVPRSGRGQLGAAIVLKEQGDYGAALAKLRGVLALHPGNVRALVAAASVHAARGEDARAERYFSEALSRNPDSPTALNSLGLFRERRGRYDEALAFYARAASLDPQGWSPRYNMAVALEAVGRPVDALAALMQAAALQPGRNGFLEEINRLSDSLRDARLTTAQWEEIGRAHAALLQARGIHCARTGDTEGAVDNFEKLIALEPRNGEARANLGRTYAARGEYRRALGEFRAAAGLLPGAASVYSGMGACCAALGLRDEAERAWQTALRLDPRAKEPRRNLSRLRHLR